MLFSVWQWQGKGSQTPPGIPEQQIGLVKVDDSIVCRNTHKYPWSIGEWRILMLEHGEDGMIALGLCKLNKFASNGRAVEFNIDTNALLIHADELKKDFDILRPIE